MYSSKSNKAAYYFLSAVGIIICVLAVALAKLSAVVVPIMILEYYGDYVWSKFLSAVAFFLVAGLVWTPAKFVVEKGLQLYQYAIKYKHK